MIEVGGSLVVADDEVEESFIQAGGPGGQNVNKVATAVQLRFDLVKSRHLPDPVKYRLARIAGRRMTQDGVIVIEARRFRSQDRNRADARDRLAEMIAEALQPPPPPRRPTRPTRSSKERRLKEKRSRSSVKQGRGRPAGDD